MPDTSFSNEELQAIIARHKRLSTYVREMVICITEKQPPKKKLTKEDDIILNKLNAYFVSEGVEPLPDNYAIPERLAEELAASLFGPLLNRKESFLNTGEDATERNRSEEKLASLSSLFRYLSDYYELSNPNTEQSQDYKLWKFIKKNDAQENRDNSVEEVKKLDDDADHLILRLPGLTNLHQRKKLHLQFIEDMDLIFPQSKAGNENQSTAPSMQYYVLSMPYANYFASLAEIYATNSHIDTYFNSAAEMFVEDIILPWLGVSENQHPSVDLIAERMRRLTLVSNSYGTCIAQHIENVMPIRLKRAGYSDAEISSVMPELFHLAIFSSSAIPTQDDLSSFKQLRIISDNDFVAKSRADQKDELFEGKPRPAGYELHTNYFLYRINSPHFAIDLDWLAHEKPMPQKPTARYSQALLPPYDYDFPPGHFPRMAIHDMLGDSEFNKASAEEEGFFSQLYSNKPIKNAFINGVLRNDNYRQWETIFNDPYPEKVSPSPIITASEGNYKDARIASVTFNGKQVA